MKPIMKRCKGNPDPDLTDELGFSFGAWNGNYESSTSVLITCRLYNPHLPNTAVLDLFRQPFPGNQESKDQFKRLLDACK